jgi:hypothetical protein
VNPGGPWNGWSAYWLAWLALGFLVPELIALFTNPANTLSWQVWRLAGVGQPGAWSFAHFIVAAFCIWLAGHFVLGLWR